MVEEAYTYTYIIYTHRIKYKTNHKSNHKINKTVSSVAKLNTMGKGRGGGGGVGDIPGLYLYEAQL